MVKAPYAIRFIESLLQESGIGIYVDFKLGVPLSRQDRVQLATQSKDSA